MSELGEKHVLAEQHTAARAERVPRVERRRQALAARSRHERVADQRKGDSHEETGEPDADHGGADLERVHGQGWAPYALGVLRVRKTTPEIAGRELQRDRQQGGDAHEDLDEPVDPDAVAKRGARGDPLGRRAAPERSETETADEVADDESEGQRRRAEPVSVKIRNQAT